MCPSNTSRQFAILKYILLSVAVVFAIIYTHNKNMDFHIYIFSIFIAFLLSAAFCAYKNFAQTERRIVRVLMAYCLAALFSNLVLFNRLGTVDAVCFMIIEIQALLFFIHRQIKLDWLIKQSNKLKEKGVVI